MHQQYTNKKYLVNIQSITSATFWRIRHGNRPWSSPWSSPQSRVQVLYCPLQPVTLLGVGLFQGILHLRFLISFWSLAVLKVIKNWRSGRPGKEANLVTSVTKLLISGICRILTTPGGVGQAPSARDKINIPWYSAQGYTRSMRKQ